jgi:hypothetical protein
VHVAVAEPSDELVVVAGHRVAEGGLRQIVGKVPAGGPAMEPTDLGRMTAAQLLPQEVGEEPVEAKPRSLVVERHEKEVLALQTLQRLLTEAGSGHGVAQRPGEAIQDAGSEQEAAQLVGQVSQHVFAEVVGDVAVVAADAGDVRHGLASAEGERSELQTRDPTLQLGVQRAYFGVGQGEARQPIQEVGGLLQREAKLLRAQLQELVAGPVAGQREWRLAATRQHDVAAGRQVVEQVGLGPMDRRLDQEVSVVEDEDRVRGQSVGGVEEGGQDGRGVGRHATEQEPQRSGGHVRLNPFPGRQEVAEEALERVVLLGDRQPGYAVATRPGPLRQQGGLAVPRGRRDQDESVVRDAAFQGSHEAVAAHQAMRPWRNPCPGHDE